MGNKERQIGPDDLVRFVSMMRRQDRIRLKVFCEMRGLDMEKVGAQWIVERLKEEESGEKKSRR